MNETPETPDRVSPPRGLLWIVAVAFFMQMLDGTILNTALPGMAAELGVAPLRMQAVVIAYMLTAAAVIPAASWFTRRFGTRRVFVAAIGLFTLGSLLCALSPTVNLMTLSRVVQGLGGAMMVPVGRLAAIEAYPRSEMVRVLSFITIPGLVGPLVGPVAGGFLVEYASWHWIFLINLPIGLVGGVLAWRTMADGGRDGRAEPFDLAGFLLFGGAMALVCAGMEGLGELHWPKAQAILLSGTGFFFFALYWLRAVRMEAPLFPPRLFRVRRFAIGILGNLFSRLGSGAMPFLTPLFLQLVLGFSPFEAGLTMIPSAVTAIVGKSIVNRLAARLGFRRILIVNTLALGVLVALFSQVGPATSRPLLWLLLAVFGLVNSLQFTVMNTVTLVDLPKQDTNNGNGLLSVVMQLSNVCGVAMAAAVLDGFLGSVHPAPADLTGQAFRYTYLCIGTLSLLTGAIFVQLPRDGGRPAADA